ncbi:hypothetical protein TgHK011_005296 [Trichoderma gracile]|nr:hypothetical protein TgHK011_005296 [Trichoderma gracile]
MKAAKQNGASRRATRVEKRREETSSGREGWRCKSGGLDLAVAGRHQTADGRARWHAPAPRLWLEAFGGLVGEDN